MPIELAALASTVVGSFLLPYAKAGIEKIAEGVTGAAGKAAAQHVTEAANKIWNRVKSVFSSEGEKFTLSEFEKDPETAKGMVESILKRKFEADSSLVKEFSDLVNKVGPDGKSTTAQIMNAGVAGILVASGDFSHSTGARLAGVMMETPEKFPTAPQKDPDKDAS
jgi:hypothetical protein